MKHILTIKGRMVSLNEYINAERHNRYEAAHIKKDETERVAWEAKAQKLPVFSGKVCIQYHFFVNNHRQDEDNLLIYIKWINDGLVLAGTLKGDSRRYLHIAAITFHDAGSESKTVMEIEPVLP